MITVTEFSFLTQLALIVLMLVVRHLFEKLLSRLSKVLGIDGTTFYLFATRIVIVVFNVAILYVFGLLSVSLFVFANWDKGRIFLAIGVVFAVLISLLTYAAVRTGKFGKNYHSALARSPVDIVFTLLTFLFLAGPAEDLFFIGFAQNILIETLGWVSILVYVGLFTIYHYVNVLSGVEKKEEFFAVLPVRLLIATLLSTSFYTTTTLIYAIIVHNVFDTLNYIALLLGNRHSKKLEALSSDG